MALSERELLILDCFMYSDIATHDRTRFEENPTPVAVGDAISRYFDENGNASADLITKAYERGELQLSGDFVDSSGIYPDKLADVLQKIHDSDKLSSLEITYTTPEKHGEIRAACFYDPADNDVTIAFRGTGGSLKQWYNNFEGFGEYEQATQKAARKFVAQLPKDPPYDQIDVTGHSNGGNQAMYVSALFPDKIRRCVAYEGQGLSNKAYNKLRDQGYLPAEEGKITNISGQADDVSAILIPIASTSLFVRSNSDNAAGHGSYGLLEANEGYFDENGNFREDAYVERDKLPQIINEVTVFLDSHADTPYVGPILEFGADCIGIFAGLAFDGGWSNLNPFNLDSWKHWMQAFVRFKASVFEFKVNLIKDRMFDQFVFLVQLGESFYQKLSDKIAEFLGTGGAADAGHVLVVNTGSLNNYAARLNKVNARLGQLDKRMDALYTKVGLYDLWNLIRADLLTKKSGTIRKCVAYLDDTAKAFEKVEKELADKI